METLLPFIVAGIASGAIYGLAGTGLVLTYTTSGVFNFAHGAIAAAAAYVFYWLNVENGWNWLLAFIVAGLVFGALLGIVLESLMRNVAAKGPALQVAATVGLILAVQALTTIKFGSTTLQVPQFLPAADHSFSVGSVHITYAQVEITAIAVISTIALYFVVARTRFGLRMRAVVNDPVLVAHHGTSPERVRTGAWIIGAVFAAASGILLAPVVGLNAINLTYLIIAAVGAVAIGSFSSIPLTLLGGIIIGILASVSQKYVVEVHWLSGVPLSLPFIILLVALLVTPRRKLVPPTLVAKSAESRIRVPWPIGALIGVAILVALFLVPSFAGDRLIFYIQGLSLGLMLLSLGLLVRTSGQVSLCQAAFAAIGAVVFSQLAIGAHLGWMLAALLGSLAVVPIAALVALPAMRLTGVFLALATLGFGILVERLIYPMSFAFTESTPRGMPRPEFAVSDRSFYYFVVAIVVIAALLVGVLRVTRLGRLLRGMSGSQEAMTSLGVNLSVTKVLVFCVAGFLAGLSGIIYGSTVGVATYSDPTFSSFHSLVLMAMVMAIPLGVPWVAAVGIPIALVPTYFSGEHSSDVLNLIFGLAAISVALTRGAPELPGWLRRALDRVPSPALRRAAHELAPVTSTVNAAGVGLSLADIRVRFGGLVAVDGVTLDAPAGQITGLIGPNGAGKTTLFNASSGVVRGAGGEARLGGANISGASSWWRARLGLGRTFQSPKLFDGLTVRANVELGKEARLAGWNPVGHLFSRPATKRSIAQTAEQAMSVCGIAQLADVGAGSLSTGERRLVEIARCLAGGFDVILLDEPCGGLDGTETEHLRTVLERVVRERRIAMLIVEHDMSFIMRSCAYIYVLDFGKPLFEGSPAEVSQSPVVQAAYLGEGGDASQAAATS